MRPTTAIAASLLAAIILSPSAARADYVHFRSNVWPVRAEMVLDLPGVPGDEPFETFDPQAIAAFTVWELSSGDFRYDMSEPFSVWLDSDASGFGFDNALAFLQATDTSFFGPSQDLVSLSTDASGSQIFTAAGPAAASWTRSFTPRLPATPRAHFLHVARTGNTSGDATVLRHPEIDGDPRAILIVTPHVAPAGSSGLATPEPIAVRYDAGTGYWSIVQQTGVAIPLGAAYNVLVPPDPLDPTGVDSAVAFIHERTNTVSLPSTQMLHPATTGNPDAAVFVTQNLSPDGASAPANPHVVSVYFDGGWWRVANTDGVNMPTGTAFNVYVGPGLTHEVTAASASLVSSDISDPRLDGRPRKLVHVQRVHDPASGSVGEVGVGYNTLDDEWAVVYMSAVPTLGDRFHVLALPEFDVSLRRSASSTSWLSVNHVYANDRPGVAPVASQVGGSGVPTTPAELAVDLVADASWRVRRLDGGSLAGASEAAIRLPDPDLGSFTHVATSATLVGNSTRVEHPLSDGDPGALVFVTQSLDAATPSTSHVGVWYSGGSWLIFNQDFAAMQAEQAFEIYIAGAGDVAFTHIAAPGTISGALSYIDHPELNGHPHAVPIVTQNWNQTFVYNDHPVGVWYDDTSERWAVWNSDGLAMTPSAGFNVLVRPATCGDVDGDGRRTSRDVRDIRRSLAGLGGPASPDHCSVSGGADDCDLLDYTLMRREQLRLATAVTPQPVCRAAVGI